jgi:hypothetical protein
MFFAPVSPHSRAQSRRLALTMMAGGLGLAALVACSQSAVVSGEQAPGGKGAPSAGGNGAQAAGGMSGSSPDLGTPEPVIALPDAAIGHADTPAPACAEEGHKAEAVPVDLLLLVDASGSMRAAVGPGAPSKWVLAQEALMKFVTDPRSAGLGMGLQFFPPNKPCDANVDCGPRGICLRSGACLDGTGTVEDACHVAPTGTGYCQAQRRCVLAGVCSETGSTCLHVGQPCPMNAGMCTAPASFCALTVEDECASASYDSLVASIAPLPQNRGPLLVGLRGNSPSNGGTPMRVAVETSLQKLRTHLAKVPGRKGALVLATDGFPGCTPPALNDLPAITNLVARARSETPSVSTYVIGTFSAAEITQVRPLLDMVATAGGTGQAFVVTANTDLSQQLQAALAAIRGSALNCEFKIPTGKSELDYGAVRVSFTTSAGKREQLDHVKSMADCDPVRGGWYYDVDPTQGKPTTILACPASCQTFRAEGSGKVDLSFGCSPG